MYKNRNARTSANLDLQTLIRRADIAFDERALYVDSVCRALIESRFGPCAVYEPSPDVTNRSDRPESKPELFSDLLDHEADWPNGLAPFHASSPLGRAARQKIEAAFRRAKQMGLLAPNANGSNIPPDSASNQGRGSP